jgi:hypothetical protein
MEVLYGPDLWRRVLLIFILDLSCVVCYPCMQTYGLYRIGLMLRCTLEVVLSPSLWRWLVFSWAPCRCVSLHCLIETRWDSFVTQLTHWLSAVSYSIAFSEPHVFFLLVFCKYVNSRVLHVDMCLLFNDITAFSQTSKAVACADCYSLGLKGVI